MRAGRLDRQITIETKTVTRDSYGGEIETWGLLVTVWAEIRKTPGGERFIADQPVASESIVFKIRYLPGLKRDMRIQYDGLIWDIRGIAEIGRREGLELMAEAVRVN